MNPTVKKTAAPRVRSVKRIRFRAGVVVAALWLCIWIIISVGLIDIALEQFNNNKNYLTLLTWLAGIAVGYFFSLLILILARRRQG